MFSPNAAGRTSAVGRGSVEVAWERRHDGGSASGRVNLSTTNIQTASAAAEEMATSAREIALSWTGEGAAFDVGRLLIAGSVNVVITVTSGSTLPDTKQIAVAALVGFFGVGVELVLFIWALRHLESARTGAYFSLAPFIGAAVAIGLLGEAVTVEFGVAAALMAVGLWLHLSELHEHEHVHEEMEHDHLHDHDAHHDHTHAEPVTGPHGHLHRHAPRIHTHVHYPDLHHRHDHRPATPPETGSTGS